MSDRHNLTETNLGAAGTNGHGCSGKRGKGGGYFLLTAARTRGSSGGRRKLTDSGAACAGKGAEARGPG